MCTLCADAIYVCKKNNRQSVASTRWSGGNFQFFFFFFKTLHTGTLSSTYVPVPEYQVCTMFQVPHQYAIARGTRTFRVVEIPILSLHPWAIMLGVQPCSHPPEFQPWFVSGAKNRIASCEPMLPNLTSTGNTKRK